jgi:hypothetical protein
LPKLLKSSEQEEETETEDNNVNTDVEPRAQDRQNIVRNNPPEGNMNTNMNIQPNYPPQEPTNRNQNNNTVNNINQAQIDPNKKLTKKDIAKMEKKKVKQDNQEAMKQMLEAKKIRDQEREKEQQEREKKRLDEEMKEEDLLKKLKMEQQNKEEDIFNQWKVDFTIAESGEDNLDFNNENLIGDFLNYIKLRKVVSLEDLSGEFKISSADLVDRLLQFEKQGRICGIIDDRGKYIYLTDKELSMIEKLFIHRGRISKTDLIKECNKIIRFMPTDEDKIKIKEEQNKVFEKFAMELEPASNRH